MNDPQSHIQRARELAAEPSCATPAKWIVEARTLLPLLADALERARGKENSTLAWLRKDHARRGDTIHRLTVELDAAQARADALERENERLRDALAHVPKTGTVKQSMAEAPPNCDKHDQNTPDFSEPEKCGCWEGITHAATRDLMNWRADYGDVALAPPPTEQKGEGR